MESLVALGLASNIVQFIDFAGSLISNAKAVYKSTSHASPSSITLRDVIGDLARLSGAIILPDSQEDEQLKRLAQRAKEIANDLLTLLNDLQVRGRKTKWKSFLVAAKEVRSQETIASMTGTIAGLQTEMTLHLQVQIKSDIASLSKRIQDLQDTSNMLRIDRTKELEKLRTDLLGAFDTINTASRHHVGHDQGHVKYLISDLERLTLSDIHTISQRLPDYTSKISAVSQGVGSITAHQDIINAFHFENFATRRQQVSKAHANTFEWIFRGVLPNKTARIGFPDWLLNGNGIFWICGKAGSGKSTLMKFISRHPTTLDYLQRWSVSQPLVLGSFYFWNPGTDLQKSQEGLLRSLIFEILRQCPELAIHAQITYHSSSVFTKGTTRGGIQPAAETIGKEGWTLRQLTEILKNLLDHDRSRKFCFFIDGLDEYKARYTQDHQELIDALKKLATSPNIKLCVSSRPWTIFMDAFNGDMSQCLKLEDLTEDDIRSYVKDKLSGHNQFHKLTQRDPSYASLVNEVAEKSQGVFLWVFLVVRELLDGFTYNDTINTMRWRLKRFPDTLEKFFQRMLESVSEIYRSQALRLFQISTSASSPLPMIFYSFLEDIEDNPHLITQEYHRPCKMDEFLKRCETMRRRLDASCKGLLELTRSDIFLDDHTEVKVDFFHRTVRDFLISGAVSPISEQPADERQRIWLLLCHAVVLALRRCSGLYLNFVGPHDVEEPLEAIACFAKKAQDDGVDFYAIQETLLGTYNALHTFTGTAISKHSRPGLTVKFLLVTCSHGLLRFLGPNFILNTGPNFPVIVAVLESNFDRLCYSPELITALISCADTRGLSSKDILAGIFRNAITKFRACSESPSGRPHLRNSATLSMLRAIACTGYKLDSDFIMTYFPDHVTELSNLGPLSGQRKRKLEDSKAEGVSQATVQPQSKGGKARTTKRRRGHNKRISGLR
ncbi:hypothetical protein NUW58_g8485 [Xylaria curta]|uniref:Uncharacterized protein n=1 Tax=Xylaria curta TaxID=42375 RepID=A0ACC1N6S7_9PEZI|nr:hypothetical protein NUW58_g8485 [Xylaria curta]